MLGVELGERDDADARQRCVERRHVGLARRAGLLSDLSRADDALVAATAHEQEQLVLVATARMRLKAVERLEERRRAEAEAAREREEAAELDDVVATLRHHRERGR